MKRLIEAIRILREKNYRNDLDRPTPGKKDRGIYRFQMHHLHENREPEIKFTLRINFGDWMDHKLLEELEKMDFEVERTKGKTGEATASLIISKTGVSQQELQRGIEKHHKTYFGRESEIKTYQRDPIEGGRKEDALEKEFHDKLVKLFIQKRP